MRVVEASDLRRSYRSRTGILKRERKIVEAVRGVSFGIEQGELFGLLGPNGAGKTTTIKMLITLLLPTGGRATVLGHDVVDAPRAVRRHIGYGSAVTAGCTNGSPLWTTCATSPSSTASRGASRGSGSATCWRWSA
jgi:ABC-type multidrug transport system ATPase subunit